MRKNVSPSVCFARFQVYLQCCCSTDTTSVTGRKNTNADSIYLQPPNQNISESVGVVFLCKLLKHLVRAHHRLMLGAWFPMSTFRFNKIDPLPPSLLLFALTHKGVSLSLCFEYCYSRKQRISQAWFELWSKLTVRVLRHSTHCFFFGKFHGSVMGFRISIFHHFENS